MRAIKHRKTFDDMIKGDDGQAIVRLSLRVVLPYDVKEDLLNYFNTSIDSYNDNIASKQRCLNK